MFNSISNPRPSVWILWRSKISLTPWYQRFTNTFLNFYFGMFLADGKLAQLFLEFDGEASQWPWAPWGRSLWRILLLLSWNQFSTISEMKQNKKKLKSQTYVWGVIVASFFLLCLNFYIHPFYSYIIWNQWIRGFLKLFSSIFHFHFFTRIFIVFT